MRLVLDRRAQRLLRRLPRHRLVNLAELALLALLAVQAARLLLVLVTPVGPLGDWRPARGAEGGIAASSGIFGAFDPFFRLAPAATTPAVVTGLALKLYGVRADQATGRGSAIIALPDGTQSSYSVGDEIMPGVTLKAVSFDGVTISRGGADEQVFLDQSQPATLIAPQGASTPVPGQISIPGLAQQSAPLSSAVQLVPQVGAAGGFALQPAGTGEAFRAAGLQPGDILVSVNGQRIAGPADADRIRQQMATAQSATIEVQRNGQVIQLSVGAGR